MADITDAQKILFTSGLTLTGGVLLFFVSNITTELILRPLAELRKVISDVAYALVFHRNYIASSTRADAPERHEAISKDLRGLSARLRAAIAAIWCYKMLSFLRVVPSKADVREAASLLIGLSNTTGDQGQDWEIKHDYPLMIERLLGLSDKPPALLRSRKA